MELDADLKPPNQKLLLCALLPHSMLNGPHFPFDLGLAF